MHTCNRDSRLPIHCVIPPHMFEEILVRGSEGQRATCVESLRAAESLRHERARLQETVYRSGNQLLAGYQRGHAGLQRWTCSARHGTWLPGVLVRGEDDPPADDIAVNEAHEGAGATWLLYNDVYGRNSIDNEGMEIVQTVHYRQNYNNAFWNGHQMIYGDGDGDIFERFTIDIDIIAHELSHGVTQFSSALAYRFQSGALNEHFSDVFGSLVKQYANNEDVTQADWLIGAQVLKGGNYALRSLKAPGQAYVDHPVLGTDPQPATMADYNYWPLDRDNGGVHINSGIPNHAFYLAAVNLGGHAWEKIGWIWYWAFTHRLGANADFRQAAQATLEVAAYEYGFRSKEFRAVWQAWQHVGVI